MKNMLSVMLASILVVFLLLSCGKKKETQEVAVGNVTRATL